VFSKLALVILSGGLIGVSVLGLRHQRSQAQSELTQAQLRINRQDERLWLLRTRIAQRVTPRQIETLTAGLVDLHPIDPFAHAGLADAQRLAVVGGARGFVGPPPPEVKLPAAGAKATKVAMSNLPKSKVPGKRQPAKTHPPTKRVAQTPEKERR